MCSDMYIFVIPSVARDLGGRVGRSSYRPCLQVPCYARNDNRKRLLPADLQWRIGELAPELPELTRAVLKGEVTGREDIKKRIKNWRPDTLRV
jgi:hypothetical protein